MSHLRRLGRFLMGLGIVFCLLTLFIASTYGVTIRVAASDLFRQSLLLVIQYSVSVYDPCRPRLAELAPARELPRTARNPRLDDVLTSGKVITTPWGSRLTALSIANARIIRSPFPFGYQPYDDPGLRQIRERYQLDRVVESAYSEFDAMVQVRSWSRSLFLRDEPQDLMRNFNALDPLARRIGSTSQDPTVDDYDPCHFFPMLYAQLLISMGHQARLVSIGHGLVEVWSNQYAKWVLMDAELDHHFEKDSIPLSFMELLEESFSEGKAVRLVRGMRYPMPENPTMVYLKREELRAEDCLPWFRAVLEFADLRNDWLTNHYFIGHPRRSEANSLVYIDPRVDVTAEVAFRLRLRPRAKRKSDVYWTLNQAEILHRGWQDRKLELEFDTVTPNFEYFEIVIDGNETRKHTSPIFGWAIHDGENTLVVRPVNRFGVIGVESMFSLSLSAEMPTSSGGVSTFSLDHFSGSRAVEGIR